MNELDQLYLDLLHYGLVSIRAAASRGDLDRCHAEAEYLHEIPTLIGKAHLPSRVYHATKARQAYLDWIKQNDRDDVRECVRTWYAPAWRRMDALLGLPSSPLDQLNQA
jgi:hypothetical protein